MIWPVSKGRPELERFLLFWSAKGKSISISHSFLLSGYGADRGDLRQLLTHTSGFGSFIPGRMTWMLRGLKKPLPFETQGHNHFSSTIQMSIFFYWVFFWSIWSGFGPIFRRQVLPWQMKETTFSPVLSGASNGVPAGVVHDPARVLGAHVEVGLFWPRYGNFPGALFTRILWNPFPRTIL